MVNINRTLTIRNTVLLNVVQMTLQSCPPMMMMMMMMMTMLALLIKPYLYWYEKLTAIELLM